MSKPTTVVRNLMSYLNALIFLTIGFLSLLGLAEQNALGRYGLASFLVIIGLALLLLIVIYIWKMHIIKSRVGAFQAYAAAQSLTYASTDTPLTFAAFSTMSLPALGEGNRPYELHNVISAPDWQYADFSYKKYEHSKYGDYAVATVYYGVMSTELPRELPNVFFDSKQARGKQFDRLFQPNQEHSLEGDFDTYFVTYFPAQYTIDSMSFISPDVMIALRDAAQYDIEIVGNKLFLYAPLDDPAAQLDDMAAHIYAIKQQLLDNILTYRDERLPYDQGRERVTPLGAALQRRKPSWWLFVGVVVIYLLSQFGQMIWNNFHN